MQTIHAVEIEPYPSCHSDEHASPPLLSPVPPHYARRYDSVLRHLRAPWARISAQETRKHSLTHPTPLQLLSPHLHGGDFYLRWHSCPQISPCPIQISHAFSRFPRKSEKHWDARLNVPEVWHMHSISSGVKIPPHGRKAHFSASIDSCNAPRTSTSLAREGNTVKDKKKPAFFDTLDSDLLCLGNMAKFERLA